MPLTVLVVDDDHDMRHYVSTCLRSPRLGIERVLEAADGIEALRIAHTSGVDLVITDIVVPGLDGHALCRAIRNTPELEQVALLLISGEDGPGKDYAADAFLPKPFNSQQLLSALEGLFSDRSLNR